MVLDRWSEHGMTARTMTVATEAPTTTLSSTLVTRIRASIMRGELMPGTKLNLDRMRESFGVSLSPLREALCRLENDGLVTIVDQRGYRVTPVSAANLTEIIKLRVKLEGYALTEAIRHGDVAWEGRILATLHQLSRYKIAARTVEEQESWEHAHRDFHSELISACAMPLLRQFCDTLHDQSDRYRRIFLKKHKPDRDVPAEHAAIAKTVIERRTREAVVMMREHIERTGKNIQSALNLGAA
jgi:GntR family transcriptional regulator, carbon starvation induced regulator